QHAPARRRAGGTQAQSRLNRQSARERHCSRWRRVMKRIHVAAAVVNQTPLDWEGTRAPLAASIAQARASGVTLLCLPELSIPGYCCEDAFLGVGMQQRSMAMLESLLPDTKGMVVSFGLP